LGKDEFYFNEKKLRHIKILERASEPVKVKKHIFISSKAPESKVHKLWTYATNRGNYCLCIYKGNVNGKEKTSILLKNLKTLSERMKTTNSIKIENIIENKIELKEKGISLNIYHILKVGDRVIFHESNKESTKVLYSDDLKTFSKRIYKVTDFETDGNVINLRQCLEARKENDLLKPNSNLDFQNPPPLWRGTYSALNTKVIFERMDFEIKPDGELIFKF
jgi:CRISPR-associated endonuclease Csn1